MDVKTCGAVVAVIFTLNSEVYPNLTKPLKIRISNDIERKLGVSAEHELKQTNFRQKYYGLKRVQELWPNWRTG